MSKGDFSGLTKKRKKIASIDFIEGATIDDTKPLSTLNHKAKRDFKSIRLAFNEYEYQLLEKAASEENLSLVSFIRTAWMGKAKKCT